MDENQKEYTGGSVSYYKVPIDHPTSLGAPYVAECNDIIEALGMNYAEGNAFKAIWRSCAARNLGMAKRGYKDGLYDAEKVVFFGMRMVEQAKLARASQERDLIRSLADRQAMEGAVAAIKAGHSLPEHVDETLTNGLDEHLQERLKIAE